MLDQQKRERSEREDKPDVEVQDKIPNVEMPRLYAIDVGAFTATTKNIVQDDVYGDTHYLAVEG